MQMIHTALYVQNVSAHTLSSMKSDYLLSFWISWLFFFFFKSQNAVQCVQYFKFASSQCVHFAPFKMAALQPYLGISFFLLPLATSRLQLLACRQNGRLLSSYTECPLSALNTTEEEKELEQSNGVPKKSTLSKQKHCKTSDNQLKSVWKDEMSCL